MKNKNSNNGVYISYKQLIIYLDQKKSVLLGYDFSLTKTEYTILKILIQEPQKPLSPELIIEKSCLDLNKENVVFHISSINRKAKIITNRILIKNFSKNGYFLNEEM